MYISGRLAIDQADQSPAQGEAEEISPGLQLEYRTTSASFFTIHHIEYVIQSCDWKKQPKRKENDTKEPLNVLECIEKFKKFNQGQTLAKPKALVPCILSWVLTWILGFQITSAIIFLRLNFLSELQFFYASSYLQTFD